MPVLLIFKLYISHKTEGFVFDHPVFERDPHAMTSRFL